MESMSRWEKMSMTSSRGIVAKGESGGPFGVVIVE